MRRAIAALCALVVVMGIGVVIPGVAGTASACSCAVTGPIPPDIVVIEGIVEKQQVGYRDVDVQVRVTSMYGAPPEKVTVIRAQAGSSASCGSEFRDGETIQMVVERGGPRWRYPTCSNALLSRPDAQNLVGTAPGPDASEYRLPGPPISWFYALIQPSSLLIGAVLLAFGAVAVALRRRFRT